MNIIQFGIDTSSFTEQKKATLQEFITLFNQLEKYDGAKFSPILGEGLTAFNQSISETGKLLDTLNSKFTSLSANLNAAQKSQNDAAKSSTELTYAERELQKINEVLEKTWAKLAIVTSDEARALAQLKVEMQEANKQNLEEARNANVAYQLREAGKRQLEQEREQKRLLIVQQKEQLAQDKLAASEQVKIDELRSRGMKIMSENTAEASTNVEGFGRSLTRGLSTLRTLAYILPGIGLAGIFNLAFEAISAATTALLNFEGGTEELISKEQRLNEQLADLRKNLDAVNGLIEKSVDLSKNPATNAQRDLELSKARGENQKKILEDEIKINQLRLATINLSSIATDPKAEEKIREAEQRVAKLNGQINNVTAALERKGSYVDPQTKSYITDQDEIKEKKKSLEGQLKEEQDNMNELISLRKGFLDATRDLERKRNEYSKFLADQERKYILETTKENISVQLEKNQVILKDDRSTFDERIAAIKRMHSEEVSLNKANLNNVLNDPTTNPREADIARNTFADENKKSLIKQNEEIEKVNVEFYQRRIKAKTEINKDEVEKDALVNERIYKNEQNSLDKRLDAYSKYIIDKQRLQELELQKDLQKGASSPGGKTSLTDDEQTQIKATALKQQVSIQADAEKQIYDIVYTSTQKQLKEVLSFNKLTESDRKKAYTDELHDLNTQFENKVVNYEAYRKKRLEIDRKYALIELDNNVKDDEVELKRLQDFSIKERKLRDEANSKIDIATTHFESIKEGDPAKLDAKRELDKLVGERNAYNSTIKDSDEALAAAQKKLVDDELAREKAKFDLLKQYNKDYAAVRVQIEEKLFVLAKAYLDGQYQSRLQILELNKQTIDEEYGNEIGAIEKSSLSAKQKAALDIQLNAEKQARDKDAMFQERELKRQQAYTDRDLTLAHIAWNTEEAISKTYATFGFPIGTPLALAQGALGLIEAATVLATPIPYAEGTPVGGHQHPDRLTLTGEAGTELIKKPYQSPYFVSTPTISYLPKGTDVIPIREVEFSNADKKDDSWDQTRWLAKQFSKGNKEIKNVFKPNINVDLNFQIYKSKILGR